MGLESPSLVMAELFVRIMAEQSLGIKEIPFRIDEKMCRDSLGTKHEVKIFKIALKEDEYKIPFALPS